MNAISKLSGLAVINLQVSELKPYHKNARTHSKKQIGQVAASIQNFGFNVPILVDEDQTVLAGHARLEAAKRLGFDTVPCVRLSHMSKAQKKAFILADNKLAANAGWDEEMLSLELKDLINLDKDFEIGVTGFSVSEIDSLVEGLIVEEPGDPKQDRLPDIPEVAVTRAGDRWLLGPHRLVCGSALSAGDCSHLMGGEKAQFVITDPPYNMPIAGHVSGLGRVRHREFAVASGEMTAEQFKVFLETAFQNLAANSTDGSIHMVFMDWRHLAEVQAAGASVYSELKNLIVWVKDNGGMGSFYRSRHELIFAFKNGTAPHVNSFELGQHGRYRTNVWTCKGMNSFGAKRNEELGLHPTVKPVALLADAIKDVSTRGSVVLDLFGGSGSTLIAAHKTGRRGYSEPERDKVNHWFDTALLSRLDNRHSGAVIVVMQRLHEHDLTGHLLEKGGWRELSLPARNIDGDRRFPLLTGATHLWPAGADLMPSRLPAAIQQELLASMGESAFSAQYLQRPVPAGGNIVKTEWFQSYAIAPERSELRYLVHSYDVATKPSQGADYSVCTVWGMTHRGDYYLLDCRRVRVTFPDLLRLARELIRIHPPTHVLVEDAANGTALYQELQRERGYTAVLIRPKHDKEARLHAATPAIEAGRVHLPETAPWRVAYLAELTGFPGSRHDDQVDSTSQFLNWAEEKHRRPTFIPEIWSLEKEDPWLT